MLYPKKLQKQASVGSMAKSTTNFFKGLMPKSTPGRIVAGTAVGGYLGNKVYKAKQRNKKQLTRSLRDFDRRSPEPVAMAQREIAEPYIDYYNSA